MATQEPAPEYDISAIIVNFNSGELLAQCLDALAEATGPTRLEVIVVDNGSTDGSIDRLPESPLPIHVIRAGQNLGFGQANNLGARAARGRYYLLVNTDCFVLPGLPVALIRRLEAAPEIGATGPRLRNPDGTLQPSAHNFPSPLILFLEQSLLWRLFARRPLSPYRPAIAAPHDRPMLVDWLSGACLLIRPAAFEQAGGFDPEYFFYWEEADLCRRMGQAGWRVAFEPAATAVHLGGGSSQSPGLRREFFVSLYRFYRRHYTPWQLVLARLIVAGMSLIKAGRAGSVLFGGGPAGARTAALQELRSWLAVGRL